MTTYPLSETANDPSSRSRREPSAWTDGRGTLEDYAAIAAELPYNERQKIAIQMDDIDLRFDPEAIKGLIRFLQAENPGLTDKEIANIKS